MSPTWHRLTLQQSNLPPLLFQFTWTRKGYVLYITDLTFIWSEELSHQQILKQAEENATTIDPSEDQDQFQVLLVKIGEALRGDGGSATLNGSGTNDLTITTSSKLPTPLRPLKWIMRLTKQSSPSITDQLLLPLLRDEAAGESRQRFLLDQLKQKDWVLGKLFDKFEALGVDLELFSPVLRGFVLRKEARDLRLADSLKALRYLMNRSGYASLRELHLIVLITWLRMLSMSLLGRIKVLILRTSAHHRISGGLDFLHSRNPRFYLTRAIRKYRAQKKMKGS